MSIQGSITSLHILPPSFVLHWTVSLYTPVWLVTTHLAFKLAVAVTPYAELLVYVDGVLPVKRSQVYWGKV